MRRRTWPAVIGLFLGISIFLSWHDPLYKLGRNIEIYARVLQELALNYVDEPDLDKLTTEAIEQMLATLDPYTNFYSSVDVTQGQLEQSGRYAGVGVLVQEVAGRMVVRRVFAESPAQKAGIQPGDILIEIDRQTISRLSLDKVQGFLRGAPNTVVQIAVERPSEKQRYVFDLRRAELEPPAIPYSAVLSGEVGYIALTQFTRGCAENFRQELIRLKAQAPLKGLIIDLRGNPGGLLQEALEILNLFVPKGELLLETRGRMTDASQKYYALMHPFEPTLPVAILIDEHSASASEIVAGTLQDLDRAVILGHRSFGKGLVQVVRPLAENTQMKITVSRYYTPSGRCIQLGKESGRTFRTRVGRLVREANGIMPDIELPSALPIAFKDRLEPYVFLFSAYAKDPVDTATLSSAALSVISVVIDSIARYPEALESEEERLLHSLQKRTDTLPAVQKALDQTIAALRAARLAQLQTGSTDLRFLVSREMYYRQANELYAYQFTTREDPWINEAKRLLTSPQRYQQILKP